MSAATLADEDTSATNSSRLSTDAAVLSPAQLIRCLGRRPSTSGLPSLGEKRSKRTGQEEGEDAEITDRLGQLFDLLSEPRISPRSQLSEAVWEAAPRNMARVTKACGKHWEAMGQLEEGTLWLRPEEALFLLESSQILLTACAGAAVSIQRAYELMIGADCSLEEYRTYSHLVRQGFKVVRHRPGGGIGDEEVQVVNQSEVDRILERIPNCYKRTRLTLATPPTELLPCRAWPKKSTYVFEVRRPKEDNGRSGLELLSPAFGGGVYQPLLATARTPPPSVSHRWGNISLEDNPWVDRSYSSAATNGRSNHDVRWDRWRGQLRYKRKTFHRGQQWSKRSRESHFGNISSKLPAAEDSADDVIIVGNEGPFGATQQWYRASSTTEEMNNEVVLGAAHSSPSQDPTNSIVQLSEDDDVEIVATKSVDSALADGPLSALWRGKTKPLLQPRHAQSTAAVLRRIRPRPILALFSSLVAAVNPEQSGLKVSFDVFSPRMTYRKSAPGPPNYRVAVVPSGGSIPDQDDLERLAGNPGDAVPLLCAACGPGSVTFYCFSRVELPTDIPMNE